MSEKGTCKKHGEFYLVDGCAGCLEEQRRRTIAQEAERTGTIPKDMTVLPMDANEPELYIVKVQFHSETTGELSSRGYTYYSEDPLEVGDIVSVPVRGTTAKAKVSAVGVPESEIAAFKDSVKIIPTGAKLEPRAEPEPEVDTKINLCDTCGSRNDYPICTSSDVEFGDGQGNDNIIQCGNYDKGEAKPCSIPLNVEIQPCAETGEPLTITDELLEETAIETAIALRPGEDVEAQIKVVVEARGKAAELKSQRDTLLEEWNKANQGLFDELTQAGAEVATVEAKLRELTLEAYAETGNKAPALGVSIKIFQTLDYDPKEALKWAMAHQIALSLDKESFETFAKATPLEFVTIGEEPRAQIAQILT